MPDPVADAKRALRAELRERRQLLSDAARDDAAHGIAAQLADLVERTGARSVSCFLSTPTEPGTRLFVEDAARRGIRVLLPISRADGLLDWSVASPDFDITEGLFGLPEPVGRVLDPAALDDVDLMLIPAAAIDRSGMRLGWGRGYFDKAMAAMTTRPPVYAVVFDSEFVDKVPRDAHDQPVDGLVTPTQTLTFAAHRR